jgi:hypothetical protein
MARASGLHGCLPAVHFGPEPGRKPGEKKDATCPAEKLFIQKEGATFWSHLLCRRCNFGQIGRVDQKVQPATDFRLKAVCLWNKIMFYDKRRWPDDAGEVQ